MMKEIFIIFNDKLTYTLSFLVVYLFNPCLFKHKIFLRWSKKPPDYLISTKIYKMEYKKTVTIHACISCRLFIRFHIIQRCTKREYS